MPVGTIIIIVGSILFHLQTNDAVNTNGMPSGLK